MARQTGTGLAETVGPVPGVSRFYSHDAHFWVGKTMRRLVIIALAICAFGGGYAFAHWRAISSQVWHGTLTEDLESRQIPAWAQPCHPPSDIEAHRDMAALQVLQMFPAPSVDMRLAAMAYFGQPWQRRSVDDRDVRPPCLSDGMKDEITKALDQSGGLGPGLAGEEAIGLVEQLGPRQPAYAALIAATAFSPDKVRLSDVANDPFGYDIRPHARMVLAELGAQAQPWAAKAVSDMSAKDALGIGAAQVAVGGGDPRALPAVRDMMVEILARTPESKPVPLADRRRLYQLAYALGMAGSAAEPYSAPLASLLARKIESRAPPYGLIAYDPIRMCAVAAHIGGRVAAAAQGHVYCRNALAAFEQ